VRLTAAVALTAVTTIVLPTTLSAQQSDVWRRCFASEGVTPEQKLESCTLLIESGGQTSRARVAAFNSRGNVHLGRRNYDRAIDDYNEAIRLDPTYAIGFNNRGLAHQRKGEIDRAIEDYDEAIRLNPRLAAAFFARADAYRDKAQWDFDAYLADGVDEDRAIADYDEVLRLQPNNAAAFRNRGFLNTRRQRYDRAIQDFDEAIRLDPNVAASFSGRAYALRFVGQYDRAIADYRKALTLRLDDMSRSQIVRVLKQLGVTAAQGGAPANVSKR
jgi:tetratricopeptide (TPR) repeat protein